MARRLIALSCVFLATAGYLVHASQSEHVPRHQHLDACPAIISDWSGRSAGKFDAKVLAVLGADDYLNRIYSNRRGAPIGLYIGYYESQRQGDTIHSPLNCLPGAGWIPVHQARIRVPVRADLASGGRPSVRADRQIEVNRIVIEKGLDQQLVLYWYQSHGRVVASEYWGKIYMVLDAMRLNRTDGALVRVISPITTTDGAAEREAVDFVQSLFPLLSSYLPA